MLLQIEGLVKHFHTRGGVVRAVDGVDLQLERGETLGLVGESGCGKSTLGRLIVNLIQPDSGRMSLKDDSGAYGQQENFRRRVQIVFQDPYRSLNPRRTAGQAVAEPLQVHGLASGAELQIRTVELLQEVGLEAGAYHRYPHEFSGGQRQRIGIARALAVQPDLVVLDEPVSALDVSVQAQIVQLLRTLQQRRGLSYLFISHNLGVVRHMAHRVAVMYLGKIVETAPVLQFYAGPLHPYSQALLRAVPEMQPGATLAQPELTSDPQNPIAVPAGCRFHPRCRLAREVALEQNLPPSTLPASCQNDEPARREVQQSHAAACHFAERLLVGQSPQ